MRSVKKLPWGRLILVFFLLAIVSELPQLVKQTMYMNSWDVPFHLSRMYEFEKGFEAGKWLPDISAYTFGQNGYGVNLFYGYSFTYLVAVIYFLTQHAVTAVLIGYVILLTLAMCLNFYAGMLFFNGKHAQGKAFFFSALYVLAPVTFGELQVRGLPGELIGILLFPAVLAAFYSIMFTEQKNWIFAGIVSALVVTNHVLSATLLILVLIVMFISCVWTKQLTSAKTVRLVKAGLLAILLSAFYVWPFVQHLLTAKVAGANSMWGTVSVWDSIAASINNQAILNWTAIPVGVFVFVMSIFLVLGLFYLKVSNKYLKQIGGWLAISVVVIFYAPTELLAKTPLHVFQMMGRFYPIVMLFALLFVVEGLYHFYDTELLRFKTLNWLFVFGVVLALSSAWCLQVQTYYNDNPLNGDYRLGEKIFPNNVSNNDFVYQMTHYYQLPLGSKDYLGKGRVKFDGDYQVASWGDGRDATRIYVDGKFVTLKLTHQGYRFTVNNISPTAKRIVLPMTNYKGWEATGDNGKKLAISTVAGKLAVATQGSTTIHLAYHKTLIHWLGIAVSIFTVLILILGRIVTWGNQKRLH